MTGNSHPAPTGKPSEIETMERPVFEEDATHKTGRKMKENPMVPIGMAGFFAAAFYGIRHFRNRPKHVSASMYIMQFRVFAQSIAVGCISAGMAFTIFKDKFSHKEKESDKKHQHHHHDNQHHNQHHPHQHHPNHDHNHPHHKDNHHKDNHNNNNNHK